MSAPTQRWADLLQGGTEGILLRLIALTPPLAAGAEHALSRVTLQLENGRELSGNLLGRSEGRGQAYLLSGSSGTQRGQVELIVAEADSIAAVTIHHPEWFTLCIEDERKPSPTKLELQRLAAEASKTLREATKLPLDFQVGFDDLPDAPNANRYLAELLRVSVAVLTGIAKDDMGHAALAEVKKVRIGLGTALAAGLQGDLLDLRAELGPGKIPDEAQLRESIEKTL
jgi:hypothetical protein